MTKITNYTRAGSLSGARLLLVPLDILPLNNDNTFNNHRHKYLRVHMHRSGARDAPGRRHGHTPIAAHAPRRPSTGKRGGGPGDAIVEELELRQRACEMFSGSEKRHHGDLCRAQKRVRQPRMRGAAG